MHKQHIQEILQAAQSSPRHRFGQHFMLDDNMLETIAAAAHLTHDDLVLEVGPGVGNLTAVLARQAGYVLAVDIDGPLLQAAASYWHTLANVRWLHADALAGKHCLNPQIIATLDELRRTHNLSRIKLVSNLPYNAACPLIAELLIAMWLQSRHPGSGPLQLDCLAFTVQWEVAKRMAAGPGSRDYGALGILIQLLARVEILRPIDRHCFWPAPKVKSALVRIIPQPSQFTTIPDVVPLQRLLAALFAHRRQTLANAIRHGLHPENFLHLITSLQAAGINPNSRPAELTPSDFIRISELLPA